MVNADGGSKMADFESDEVILELNTSLKLVLSLSLSIYDKTRSPIIAHVERYSAFK